METYEVNDTLFIDALAEATNPSLRIRRKDGAFVVITLNEVERLVTALTDARADLIAEQVAEEKRLIPCAKCNGTGRVPFYDGSGDHMCELCSGEGMVWVDVE